MANLFLSMIVNPINSVLLRSPLHGLASRSTMLITVHGRVTGRPYTFPVGYRREGDVLTVLSPRSRRWWTNLRGGAPVTVVLRGREYHAAAELVPANHEFMVNTMRAAYPWASAAQLRRMADETVMIRVCLASAQAAPASVTR